MYNLSFTLTILTICSSFLFLFKNFARVNLYFYSILYFLSTITRPYSLYAIDNENLAKTLIDNSSWTISDYLKYIFTYYLTLPFEDYKLKFLTIIITALIFLSIGITRFINFFRQSKYHSNNWHIFTFLILLLLPCISAVLYLVHLRQFLSFSIVVFLISFIIKPSNYNKYIILISSILIISTHQIYVITLFSLSPLVLTSFISIKQINNISYYNLTDSI